MCVSPEPTPSLFIVGHAVCGECVGEIGRRPVVLVVGAYREPQVESRCDEGWCGPARVCVF